MAPRGSVWEHGPPPPDRFTHFQGRSLLDPRRKKKHLGFGSFVGGFHVNGNGLLGAVYCAAHSTEPREFLSLPVLSDCEIAGLTV